MMVGMAWIWNWPANSGWASVSTLPKVMSGVLLRRALVDRREPHGTGHTTTAQKSTRTMPSLAFSSKFSDVNATVVIVLLRSLWVRTV